MAHKLSPGKDIYQSVEEKQDVDLGAARSKTVVEVTNGSSMGNRPVTEGPGKMSVSGPFQRVPWVTVENLGLAEDLVWTRSFNVRNGKHDDETTLKIICYAFDHQQDPE